MYNIKLKLIDKEISNNSNGSNATYEIHNINDEVLKNKICKNGYKSTFKHSEGNDIKLDEIQDVLVWVSCGIDNDYTKTYLYLSINDDMDLLYINSIDGNHIENVEWFENELTHWFDI